MIDFLPLPACGYDYAEAYKVPPALVQAIRIKESSANPNVGKVCKNSDGSCDLGVMQINEWWLDKLHKQNITAKILIEDECVNLAVGTWILATNYFHHKDWKVALAVYNTGKPNTQTGFNYADSVLTIFNNIKEIKIADIK